MVLMNIMGIKYSLIVMNLIMMKEIAMLWEEQHSRDHIQMVKSKSNNSEVCEVCKGSGSNGDGTCSSCNGTGLV